MNDYVLSTQILTEFEIENPTTYNVRALVLLVENTRFHEAYNLKLLGKEMKEWVRTAVKNFESRFVAINEKDNPFEIIKPFIRDEDYTIVLFSDTPCLTENTILEVLDYTTTKNLDYCKLPRGFIINSKNYKSGKILTSAEPNFIEKNNFFVFYDAKTLSICENILKERILEKHLKNRVIIHDLNSTYIEDLVEIAPLTEIYPNNSLRGETVIKENVILFENNIIINSTLLKNCKVTSSYLKNVTVNENTIVGPFETLKDE